MSLLLTIEINDQAYESICQQAEAVGKSEALTTDRHFEQEGFRRLLVAP